MPVDIGYDLGSDEFAAEKPLVGEFLARIARCELKQTRAGGNMYIVELEIIDGDDDPETGESPVGRQFTEFLPFPAPSMKPRGRTMSGQRLREFIEATGNDYAEGAPDPEDLVDVQVATRTKASKNQDGEPTTTVAKWHPEAWWEERGTTE